MFLTSWGKKSTYWQTFIDHLFKQNTVYVENMILAFEEDSVLSMISHVHWELEGKEELKK